MRGVEGGGHPGGAAEDISVSTTSVSSGLNASDWAMKVPVDPLRPEQDAGGAVLVQLDVLAAERHVGVAPRIDEQPRHQGHEVHPPPQCPVGGDRTRVLPIGRPWEPML